MPDTPDGFREAPPASEAPAKIYLPPAAGQTPPGRKKGRKGRHFGPRPVSNPRSAHIDIRCTPAFREMALDAARAAGMSLADYIHVTLGGSRSPRARRVPTELAKVLAQLIPIMGRPGSNLNQGIRAIHQIRLAAGDGTSRDRLADLLEEALDILRPAAAEHRDCVAAIMRALGMRPDDAGTN